MNRIIPYICLIAVLVCACSTNKRSPHKPLPINQMKLITWDLMKASEWHLLVIAKDSLLRDKKEDIRLYAQVFKIHGVTKDQYYDSYKYYEAHPAAFKILSDSLDAFSSRERNHVYEKAVSPH